MANLLGIQLTGGSRRARRINRTQFDNVVNDNAPGFSLLRKFNSRLVYYAGDGTLPNGENPLPIPVVLISDPESPLDPVALNVDVTFALIGSGGTRPFTYSIVSVSPPGNTVHADVPDPSVGSALIALREAGDATVTFRATDALGATGDYAVTLQHDGN